MANILFANYISNKNTEMTRLLVKYWQEMGQENQTMPHFELDDFPIIQEHFSLNLLTNFAGYKPLNEE